MDCNEVQERIALGQRLERVESAHVAMCGACGRVAEAWGTLDAALDRIRPVAEVPAGFADRVMQVIAEKENESRSLRWFEHRWVQVGLANVGALVSLYNLFRFVAHVLVASLSFGGTP
jgi:hypothetical protein